MQKDLAEFFCEDPNSFKLNECYKSMWEFCLKFKQAVTENAKRKEQEVKAEQRKEKQREAEERQKKGLGYSLSSGSSQTNGNHDVNDSKDLSRTFSEDTHNREENGNKMEDAPQNAVI